MRSFREIKEDYSFKAEDENRLMALKDIMEESAEEVIGALNVWMMNTKIAVRLLGETTKREHLYEAQKKWFLDLFSGKYDSRYYERLIRIGIVHVKNNIDAHLMNRAINIIRNSCINIINRQCKDIEDTTKNIISLDKILDINLDVITSSYIEEEIRTYSPLYRVKSVLVDFSEKFVQSANLVLVIALIVLTIGAIGLFAFDLKKLFYGDLESGIISSLGSLLIVWVMIELMNTEISHLKGGKFRISIFVSVALVAIIRETMIATLKHEQTEIMYYLIASILVIGFIYWLVIKGEEKLR